MSAFSQSVSTRLLSSLSQQHRHGSHKIQVDTNQYPQVPMFSLVPCPTLLNTVPTRSAPQETQRVATKQVFHQHPLGDDVRNDSFSVECPDAQRNEPMLTSVTRDQSSRRRALKAASSLKPNQYPYTACNPSASYSRGIVRILCPVVVVASSPPSEPQLAALQRFNSTCCQSQRSTREFEVWCSRPLSAKRPITKLSTLAST